MASIAAVGNIELSSQTLMIKLERPLNKVSKAALAALKHLASFFLFPTRYLGAKDWSLPGVVIKSPYYLFKKLFGGDCSGLIGRSYHRRFEKKVTYQEAKHLLPYVAASVGAHCQDKYLTPLSCKNINPHTLKNIPSDFSVFDSCLLDFSLGVKISIIEKDSSEIILAFGAKNSADYLFTNDLAMQKKVKKKQDTAIGKNLSGLTPKSYTNATRNIQQLLLEPYFQNKKITLTGTCFGGSIAQFVALKLNLSAVCFNSLQLGQGLQDHLGCKALSHADEYIRHISVKTDFLNDNLVCNLANHVLSLIGIKTPGNFGRQYYIPTAYKDSSKSHTFVLGSFMKYLGFNERLNPVDLPNDF
jgi:hypothetical protein